MVAEIDSGTRVISSGNEEIDSTLGGGIPMGSLVLMEGPSDAGKSVVSQHFTYGALTSKLSMAYYTTENTVKSLMSQMSSLDLDVTDYFLCDRLRVYPLLSSGVDDISSALQMLLDHFEALPATTRLVVVDSLTSLVAQADEREIVDFFSGCKRISEKGKTIIAIVRSDSFKEDLLARVTSLCDSHLSLRLEKAGDQQVNVMEVAKIGDVDQTEGNIINFDVEPGAGMKVLSVAKAAA